MPFAVPFRLATDAGVLSFISTITVFGTPVDVTLSELALESFFPADPATAAALATSSATMSFLYRVEHDTAFPTEYTAGPWGDRLQHGGAPTALISWAAERLATREPMQVMRITVDLLRPVPIAPLQIRAEVVREGRKIQLCAVTLLHEDVVVVRATACSRSGARGSSCRRQPSKRRSTLPGPEAGDAGRRT